ncbi:hypothetical protein H17ap60334_10575 [Thermosipho africanus H17ap60334]|uniref:Uncharacterized protein n=1 Tax=Thermosipho africanus (strain TCF52B) TaxID=484019 RepID=B7IFX0_THEAB|nr:hypothetical protein [Thermosipho africanus]ACJ74984.1 conserved hypothetical protein [Thermosipho africanus TCF52B]EKF48715.1 hypothetical protein H17ap60334_10575 [Thermosipho africanus H17ap60334]
MEKGKKIISFVKYEHEIEPSYREKLANAKRKSDVREVFINTLLELLSSIDPEFNEFSQEDIKFESEYYEFSKKLEEKLEKFKDSDLHAIIERIFEAAKNRYLKIEHDENTDYFNLKK